MENTVIKVRCQRIGCNAMFSDDDNLDGSCQYHDSKWAGSDDPVLEGERIVNLQSVRQEMDWVARRSSERAS